MTQREAMERARAVKRVLLIEASVNFVVMVAKASAGFATGAGVLLGDAVHSLADLANNGVALVASRLARDPPDAEHPYGHAKFETLAVFGLGTLLAVLALEIALGALAREPRSITHTDWALALMLGVLLVNTGLATWENRWARRLDSDLLRADAGHTVSDVLTTVAVIVGWQLAAAGYAWLDRLFTLGMAALVLALAWRLFQRAIPVLVDHAAADPEEVARTVRSIRGVRGARRIRSQHAAGNPRIDVVATVDGELSTRDSHEIASAIERSLAARFGARDVTVHVEPEEPPPANEGDRP